ncbi:MAG: hypothetical protein ACK5PF_09635 [bacterium]
MTDSVLDAAKPIGELDRIHAAIRSEAEVIFGQVKGGASPTYRKICGVDPGASGALAFYDLDSERLSIHDMPHVSNAVSGSAIKKGAKKAGPSRVTSASRVGAILLLERPDVLWIEDVGSRPGQGVRSMFTFGRAVGVIEGAAGALGIPTLHVRPQAWMKEFGVVGKSMLHDASPGKIRTSRYMAAAAFPEHAKLFQRVKDDGRADAALIAMFGAKHAAGLVISKYRGERIDPETEMLLKRKPK